MAQSQSDLVKKLNETKKAFEEQAKLASARDLLGLKPHAAIFNDINKLKQAFDNLGNSQKLSYREITQAKVRLNQQIKELKTSTNGWVQALSMARAELMEIGAAAATFVVGIAGAIKFESAMADVRKTVDATQEQFNSLRKEILELGRVIPLSHQELARIAALGGQLGIPVQEIQKFTEITAKMATAFDMAAEEAGTAIGKLKNVFGLSLQEMESFGDVINRLGNTTAAKERDIIEVLLRIGGTARQFGLAREQAAALADAMLALGKTPEIAASSINALLNRLQTIDTLGSKAQKALVQLGISSEQLAREIQNNPQKAILHFLSALQQLDKQSHSIVLTNILGREFQDDIAILVNGIDSYKKALSETSDKTKFAGAMQKEFAARAQTTEKQFQLLKNTVAEIGVQLGSAFLPGLIKAMEVFRNMATAIADLIQLNPQFASLVLTITSLALLGPSLGRLFDILKLGIAGLGSFGEVQAMTAQVGLLKAEITSLGQVLSVLGSIGAAAFVGWNIGKVIAEIKVGKRTIGDWGAYFMAWIMDIVAALKLLGGIWLDIMYLDFGNIEARIKAFKEELALNSQIRDLALKGESDVQQARNKSVAQIKEQLALQKEEAALNEKRLQLQGRLAQVKARLADLEREREKTAKRALQDEAKAIQEIIRGLEERKRKTKSLLNEALRLEEQYSEEVKRQQAMILGIQESTEDKIRQIRRRSMSEAELELDKLKEFKEKLAKAESAYYAGMLDDADKYARQAQDVAASLQSQQRAIDGVSKAGELLKDIHKKMKLEAEKNFQEQQAMAEELRTKISTLDQEIEKYQKTLEGLNKQLKELCNEPTITQIDADINQARSKIEEIKRQLAELKDRTVTVTVKQKTVEIHQSGGIVGAIKRFLRGGKLPGYGGGDIVPALLEPGEFVIRKEAVLKYGFGILNALNNLRLPDISIPKFAMGGPVGMVSTASSPEVRFRIDMGGAMLSGKASKFDLDAFEQGLRKLSLRGRRV
ncbi:phage tail tape measure protein [Desulfovulcanus sp.]